MRYFMLILGLCLAVTPSYAASKISTTCPGKTGTTELDLDKVNIIACLRKSDTDSTEVWKSMSTINTTCPAGKVIASITNGIPTCGDTTIHTYQCPTVVNGQIVPGTYKGATVWVTYSNSTCNGQTSTTPISCSYNFSFTASDGFHSGTQPGSCP